MGVIEDLWYLLSIWIMVYGICGLKRRRFGRRMLFYGTATIALFAVSEIWTNECWDMLLQIAIVLFLVWTMFDEKIGFSTIMALYLVIIHAFLMNIGITIGECLGFDWCLDNMCMLLCLIITVTALIFKYVIRIKFKEIRLVYALILLVYISVITIVIGILGNVLILEQTNNIYRLRVSLAIMALLVSMCLTMGLIIKLMQASRVYKENEILAGKYLEVQKEHYEYLRKREMDTKRFRHDMRGHVTAIEALLKKGDSGQVTSYVQQLFDNISEWGDLVSVNNDIADAILNKAIYDARNKGINIVVEGHLPGDCNISSFDLCTILSNALDNAVEGEIRAGGNMVKVCFKYQESGIFIELENDLKEELVVDDGIINTSKRDKDVHGFGMRNIKKCVDRNKGYMVISTENHKFRELIYLENRVE